MSSKVTYLSTRSLAAYETMLIESFVQQQRRDAIFIRLKMLLIWSGFIGMASLALILPIFIQDFLRSFGF